MADVILLVEVDMHAQTSRKHSLRVHLPPFSISLPYLMIATIPAVSVSRMASWTMQEAGDLIKLGGWKLGVEPVKMKLKRAGAGYGRLKGWHHFSLLLYGCASCRTLD